MRTQTTFGFCAAALLVSLVAAVGGAVSDPGAAPKPAAVAARAAESPRAIDISQDGELLLLALPAGQGFEVVNTRTGQREVVSTTLNTGYFATISPDKKYVCFKDFQQVGGRLLQVPTLYAIGEKKATPLCEPVFVAGNPVASSRGQIAYTVGEELILLNADLSRAKEMDLGAVVNVLSFSPDGGRLAYGDASETISWLDLDRGTRGTVPQSSLRGYQPRFSPDGRALLARNCNGEVTACHLVTGVARSFGRALSAAWLDNDSVGLVQKTVVKDEVSQSHVWRGKMSDGSTSLLLTKAGDAEFAINASAIASATGDEVAVGDSRSGALQPATLQARPAPVPSPTPTATVTTTASAAATEATPAGMVVTNSTTVQLVGVPYIHQDYDTADTFPGGGSCCNATATLMAIQYYGRLPIHPMTCTRGGTHTSYYGYYITSTYSYNGHTFDIPSGPDWGLAGYHGGFGYFLQDTNGTSGQRSVRLSEWVADHGLTSGTNELPPFNAVVSEINSNHPVVLLNSLTSAGHYITCIGYVKNQYTLIFNDPYGNRNNASYESWNGAGVRYDWPGYNTGYSNLNTAWRLVYARGSFPAPGKYWDCNGATTGAGTAPSGVWDATSTNWSCDPNGAVATGPWVGQDAIFSAGSDTTGSYTVTVSGTMPVNNLFVQRGTVTFNGGPLNFLSLGAYYSNYVAAGCTGIFNTPFGGTAAPDKWGPGTAVYNGASTCSGYFTLNEGTLALGNNSALGTLRLVVGDSAGVNPVTVQSADATAHTFGNKLSLNAVNFNIGAGGNLTFSGPVDVGPNSSAPTVIAVSNTLTTLSGVLTNTGGLGKRGPGTLVLGGTSANTFGSAGANGATSVSGGTLKLGKTAGVAAVATGSVAVNAGGTLALGAANQITDTVPMTLAGGTFQTAGFGETLGTLAVTANSAIDLGGGASVLRFAASSGVGWTGGTTLTIANWTGSIRGAGVAQVFFGSNGSGLSAGQVNLIRFSNPPGFPPGNFAASILSTGEVVPLTATPSFTLQPQDRTAIAGDTVTFNCAASGTPAPAWQWRCCGTNLPGATAAPLVLTNVALSQAGTYSVVVTNIAGSSASGNALLSVYPSAAPTLSAAGYMANGQFQLSLTGVPGFAYAILASTNLSVWDVIQTNISPFSFTDTNAGGFPARYYRAQYVQ